jgi:uncharacterized protein (DUF1697 family)
MSTRYAALLRGINVGRANRVAMADLRSLVSDLGYSDVVTLLNTGNVVFTGCDDNQDYAARLIAASLAETLGVAVRVTVLTAADVIRAVSGNPFSDQAYDPSRLLVAFLADRSDLLTLVPLLEQDWGADTLALGDSEAYLYCPGGVAHSALMRSIGDILRDSVTSRNWNTVIKLMALVGEE